MPIHLQGRGLMVPYFIFIVIQSMHFINLICLLYSVLYLLMSCQYSVMKDIMLYLKSFI